MANNNWLGMVDASANLSEKANNTLALLFIFLEETIERPEGNWGRIGQARANAIADAMVAALGKIVEDSEALDKMLKGHYEQEKKEAA